MAKGNPHPEPDMIHAEVLPHLGSAASASFGPVTGQTGIGKLG